MEAGGGGVFNFECATQMVQTEIRGPENPLSWNLES